MITYCYYYTDPISGEGGVLERDFPMGQAPKILRFEDGSFATRDYQAEHVGGFVKGTVNPIRSGSRGAWPMKPCYASGVHSDQAPELRQHFKRHGLNIEVTKGGDPIYESAAQRKKALKCRGMHDRNSFH